MKLLITIIFLLTVVSNDVIAYVTSISDKEEVAIDLSSEHSESEERELNQDEVEEDFVHLKALSLEFLQSLNSKVYGQDLEVLSDALICCFSPPPELN